MGLKLGKNTFNVPPPKALESFALQQRIGPIAVNILSALSRIDGTVSLLDMNVEKTLGPLGKVFAELPAGELKLLTYELLRKATFDHGLPLFDSKDIDGDHAFDGLMMGRTLDIWKLLWYAFKVWYPDFLAHAATFAAKAGEPASGSKTPSTSEPPGPATA